MQSRKLNGFILNKSVESTVKNGIARARMISVEDIDHPIEVGGEWKVKSQTTLGWWYDVSEPHSIYTACSCEWSIRGNYCKHQLAILKVSTEFSWSTILEYLGIYYGSLHEGLEALMQHRTVLDHLKTSAMTQMMMMMTTMTVVMTLTMVNNISITSIIM